MRPTTFTLTLVILAALALGARLTTRTTTAQPTATTPAFQVVASN